jgi:hypothetical protein
MMTLLGRVCSYRLRLADILQSLNVNHFLAQLALATRLGIVLDASELGGVLQQLSQWLRGQLLVLIRVHILISLHIRVVRIGLAALRC